MTRLMPYGGRGADGAALPPAARGDHGSTVTTACDTYPAGDPAQRFTFDPARWSASSRARSAAASKSEWRWRADLVHGREVHRVAAAEAAAPGQRRCRSSVAGRARLGPWASRAACWRTRRMRPSRGRSTSAAASSNQQGCGAVHNKITLPWQQWAQGPTAIGSRTCLAGGGVLALGSPCR